MPYTVANGRLRRPAAPVPWRDTPNRGGALAPTYIVIHYTAGSSAGSSISWLTNPAAKASAHLVIGRDGQVTQLAGFDTVTWHAGESRWYGLAGLNRHAIGIELDNRGRLQGAAGDWWFVTETSRTRVPDAEVVALAHPFDGKTTGWHQYTQPQLDTLEAVCRALVGAYPIIDILGHDEISPGRKWDPGPAFPMHSFRSRVLGRGRMSTRQLVVARNANIRSGPGTGFDTVTPAPLPAGTLLEEEARTGDWCHVLVLDGAGDPTEVSGWVSWTLLLPRAPAPVPMS